MTHDKFNNWKLIASQRADIKAIIPIAVDLSPSSGTFGYVLYNCGICDTNFSLMNIPINYYIYCPVCGNLINWNVKELLTPDEIFQYKEANEITAESYKNKSEFCKPLYPQNKEWVSRKIEEINNENKIK